jgi:anti-sigma factor RsiW
MEHIKKEQISAYLDGQLDSREGLALETHLRDCGDCRMLRDELLEVSNLFRKAERLEPSPYLWNRIAADLNKEPTSTHSFIPSLVFGLRRHRWNFRLASATLVVVMLAGAALFIGSNSRLADRAALADIDRTYKSLATLDPETYNPFGSGLPQELEANPFKSLRRSGEMTGSRLANPGVH